jgi:Ca2+-dependent lipid-binding protein
MIYMIYIYIRIFLHAPPMIIKDSPIEFQVYDWDEDAQHDFLGKAALKLETSHLSLGAETQHVLHLNGMSNVWVAGCFIICSYLCELNC